MIILVPLASVAPQGMLRYILPVPTVFILLAMLGKNRVFNSIWMMGSTLLLGMQAMLFAFDMWVG